MKKEKKLLCGALLALVAVSAVLTFGDAAFATDTSAMPWETGLGTLQRSITGPVATVISLVAIVGAGAALIFGGNIQGFLRSAVYIVLVVGLIISANNLLTALGYTASANIPSSEFLL
ncbi:MAG: TrbC/VirB2 family protein [Synergistaceae bacterium]|jgi:type IV secretion system protein VirB2|nr:TrbC/VirB2 family protein [Synergistaceae bacterium]